SYLWGPVSLADLYISSETSVFTSPPPIQVISSSNIPVPDSCSNGGTNNLYYTCPSTGCAATDSPVIVPAAQQVTNPVIEFSNVSSFTRDNNGVILQF